MIGNSCGWKQKSQSAHPPPASRPITSQKATDRFLQSTPARAVFRQLPQECGQSCQSSPRGCERGMQHDNPKPPTWPTARFDRRGHVLCHCEATHQSFASLATRTASFEASVVPGPWKSEIRTHKSEISSRGVLQPLFQVLMHQRINERVYLAFERRGQVVERQVDPVVGDAVLREIVGADALVALTRADL